MRHAPWFIWFIGLAMLVVPATAEARHKSHDPEKFVKRLTKKLDLSADQTAQVRRVVDDVATQRRALHEQFNSQFERLHRSKMDRIEAVLTPEQRAKFAEIRAKQEERMEGRSKKKHHRSY